VTEEIPSAALLLLGRAAWTGSVEAPPGWRLCAWPIGAAGDGIVEVRAREPLDAWFREHRGFPAGIGADDGPLELLGVPGLEPTPGRIAVALLLNDWEAVAALPSLVAGPFGGVETLDCFLLTPERDPRGAAFASCRELNACVTRPDLERVAFFVVDRPERVTGLSRGVEAVVEILAAEAAVQQAGGAGLPRWRPPRPGAPPAVARGVGTTSLQTRPDAWTVDFAAGALGWLAARLPGGLASSELVGESDLRDAWVTTWGWDPVPWRWVPRWQQSRARIEAWLSENVWVGGGWSRLLEEAVLAPVEEWLSDLTALGRDEPRPEEADDEEPEGDEGDAGDENREPEASPVRAAAERLVADARRLAADLGRLARARPLPGVLEAIDAKATSAYGRFLRFKRDELILRAGGSDPGTDWPTQAELDGLAEAIEELPEEGWPALAARLEAPLRDAALREEAALVHALLRSWEEAKELAAARPAGSGVARAVPPEAVQGVVLRWILGARDHRELWRGVFDRGLALEASGPAGEWQAVVEDVGLLDEDRWLDLAGWGATLAALQERGEVPRGFWDLAGSRERLEDDRGELAGFGRRALAAAAGRNLELLRRGMEPRVRLSGLLPAGGGAALRVERPRHLDPNLARALAPEATVMVPERPAPGRLALALTWTDPLPLPAFRLCEEAGRLWRSRVADPPWWQPLTPQLGASDPADTTRAVALAVVERLRQREDPPGDPVRLSTRVRQLIEEPEQRAPIPPPELTEVRGLLADRGEEDGWTGSGAAPTMVVRLLRDAPGTDTASRLVRAARPRRSSPWASILPR